MIDRIATQLQLILRGHEPSSLPQRRTAQAAADAIANVARIPNAIASGWLTWTADSRVACYMEGGWRAAISAQRADQ
jgi:hypothetical protein